MSALPNIQSLFGGAPTSIDRLPMFRIMFEQAAAACGQELRRLTCDQPLLTVGGIEAGAAADVFAQHDGAIVTGTLNALGWNTRLLISARRSAVFAIVEMLLGGDGSQPAYAGKRPFSKIETRVASAFFERFARALAARAATVAPTSFALEAVANAIDFDALGGRRSPLFAVKLNLDVMGRGGEILVAVPQSVVVAMRKAFASRAKDSTQPDPRWAQQIKREITRASVSLSAVLDECAIELGEISRFRVGQVLELKATAHTRVHLECDGERMVVCQLGKCNGAYSLRVDDFVDREQELMNDILSG